MRALLGQGSGALFWRASDLANITREALGHHVEACFAACFPQEGTRHGVPSAQEFITQVIQELQEARTIHGDRRPPPGVAPHPSDDGGLCVCIDILGLNRASSQERFWPSCEGPPHSYVRMPFGLPDAAVTFQRRLWSILAAQEARHHAVLVEMATILKEPPEPPEPPEAQDPGGS